MNRGTFAALALLLACGGPAWSQAILAPAVHTPPPDGLGQVPTRAILQPPQPLEPPPQYVEPPPARPSNGALPREWQHAEFLLWWIKGSRLPALAAANRSGLPPVLDNPGTTVVIGGGEIDHQDRAGGRFTVGLCLEPTHTVGLEGSYFFLGTRTTTLSATSSGGGASPALGLPFLDVTTGTEQFRSVAMPGFASGTVDVSSSARLQGAELNAVVNLLWGAGYQVDGLVGFRYFELDEGLQIAYHSKRLATSGGNNGLRLGAADQFDAHNRFYGGQVGLRARLARGPVFLDVAGKVALGETFEVVRISGLSRWAPRTEAATTQQGGTFAVATNSGRFTRGAFAVLPEATVRLGVALNARTRLYVGYNLIYLSEVVRPGDQIDRNVNPTQVPLSSRAGAFFGPARPEFSFHSSDFWTQGLLVGLEYRY